MSEIELPFANSLTDITSEILSEVDPYVTDDLASKAQKFVDFVREDRLVRGGSRREKTEAYISDLEIYASAIVAHVLTITNIFRRWTDADKRYLLDRALGQEILLEEWGLMYGDAGNAYYGKANTDLSSTRIIKLRERQNRLRITPLSPQMRR